MPQTSIIMKYFILPLSNVRCPFVNYPDDMCSGLSRLKSLGLGLQSEIDSQDDSIDALLNKADKMDLKIHNTNKQIKNLK